MALHCKASIFYFLCFGRIPMPLQMIPSITSSAPPPIEVSLMSLYILLTRTSLVNPIPPQNCRQESATSLRSLPHLSLHMLASIVASSPATWLSVALYSPDLSISTSVSSSARRKWMYWLSNRGAPNAFLSLVYAIVSLMMLTQGVRLIAAAANLSSWNCIIWSEGNPTSPTSAHDTTG